jgi:hypothetical protein
MPMNLATAGRAARHRLSTLASIGSNAVPAPDAV